jgi:hypothetical protein
MNNVFSEADSFSGYVDLFFLFICKYYYVTAVDVISGMYGF